MGRDGGNVRTRENGAGNDLRPTRSAMSAVREETKTKPKRGCSAGVHRVVVQDASRDEVEFYTEGLKELALQRAALESEYQQKFTANRCAIRQLHNEKMHLRSICSGRCNVTETELEQLERRKMLAVRRLNRMTHQLKTMKADMEASEAARRLDEKASDLSKERAAGNQSVALRIQILEKSLDKVMGQQKHVSIITTGYRSALKQLLDQNTASEAHIHAVEENIDARRQDYTRLTMMYNNAMSDYNYAKDEVSKFTEVFRQERQKKDKALAEQRRRVDQALSETQVLEEREANLQHEIEDEYQRLEDIEGERQTNLERQKPSMSVVERLFMGSGSEQQTNLEKGNSYGASPEEEERLRAYEESFRNMIRTTKVTTLDELVTKCEIEYATRLQLQEQLSAKQQQLEELKKELHRMKESLSEEKVCGVSPPPTSSCLREELAIAVEEAVQKRDAAGALYTRLQTLLGEIIRGVDVLGGNLAAYRPSVRMPQTRADNLVTQLQLLQKKALSLAEEAIGRGVPPTLIDPVPVSLPLNNTRVKLRRTNPKPGMLLQSNLRHTNSTIPDRPITCIKEKESNNGYEESGTRSMSIASGIVTLNDAVEPVFSETSGTSEEKLSVTKGELTIGLLENDEPLDREQIKQLSSLVLRREKRRRQREAQY